MLFFVYVSTAEPLNLINRQQTAGTIVFDAFLMVKSVLGNTFEQVVSVQCINPIASKT